MHSHNPILTIWHDLAVIPRVQSTSCHARRESRSLLLQETQCKLCLCLTTCISGSSTSKLYFPSLIANKQQTVITPSCSVDKDIQVHLHLTCPLQKRRPPIRTYRHCVAAKIFILSRLKNESPERCSKLLGSDIVQCQVMSHEILV